MFRIVDDVMIINHGDDGSFTVVIKDNSGSTYTMQTGDTLTFSVRELPSLDSAELLKTTSSTDTIHISHVDTAKIPVGRYSCDVQLKQQNGTIITVFPMAEGRGKVQNWKNFVVEGEVSE